MIQKIKLKILKWLGIDSITREIDSLKTRNTSLEIKNLELEKRINFFESVCNIGVDVHMTTDSWAVVCIAGKKEYVDFVRLDHRDARNVVDFLKQFKRSKAIIDAPYGFIDCLRW